MRTLSMRLEQLADWTTLRRAWLAYRSGKRRRPEVALYELTADTRLLQLHSRLLQGRYHHGPHRILKVCDPKPRLIAVSSVEDRIVQTAVHQGLDPFFDRLLSDDTYACRPGRGAHRAVWRCLELQRQFPWRMHLDIRRYYPSVDHTILQGILEPRIRDRRLMALLAEIMAAGWSLYQRPTVRAFFALPVLDCSSRPHGLPVGSLTSQWWGNLYLSGLDHFVKRELKVPGFARYMDDFVIVGKSREELVAWRKAVVQWLWEHRRLEVKAGTGEIVRTEKKMLWLGYRLTLGGVQPGKRMWRRFRQQLRKLRGASAARVRRSLAGWRGVLAGGRPGIWGSREPFFVKGSKNADAPSDLSMTTINTGQIPDTAMTNAIVRQSDIVCQTK